MKLQPTRRLRYFLAWTIITCVLLGIQKMQYEDPILVNQQQSETLLTDFSAPQQIIHDEPQIIPFHPFVKDQPKMLLVLTYQRSGSTFFGKIFNKNPDVFYMFEPLDAFYSSFYGTKMTWNVPSDITSYKNGSIRILPKNEMNEVSNYLSNLLSCTLGSLPPEALIHPYIYYYKTQEYRAAAAFLKCIEPIQQLVVQCSGRTPRNYCGFRLGDQTEDRLRDCHRALHDQRFRNKHSKKMDFEKYLMCMNSLKKIVDKKCLPSLQKPCDRSPLRVAKTVRGTMQSMESILERYPNFRIIHLIRDPRAVVLSRKRFDNSALGLYALRDTNDTLIRESKLICQSVSRDIRLRMELEQKYPGRIYPIVYDDMVKGVQVVAQNVYRFLDYPDQRNTSWWKKTIKPITAADSIRRATKWQNEITFEQNRKILENCQELFELTKARHWVK